MVSLPPTPTLPRKGGGGQLALLVLLVLAACGPARPGSPADTDAGAQSVAATPSRTLVAAIRGEPTTLASKRGAGLNLSDTRRFFNADLAVIDARDIAHPYLAESLPQINTDTWRVFPDGRMATTYRLRPNLVWQDGAPLVGEDFIFAWRVYTTPAVGGFQPSPQNLIEEVVAPDDRTVVIRWRQPYPEAGILDERFSPLPRHILGPAFESAQPDAFASHAYWSTEYVGLGPYRLVNWEPGASLEGVAFEQHVLGRPKIDRIRLLVMPDPNTALANVLADAVHITLDNAIRFEQGIVLQREWAPRQGGSVLLSPTDRRFIQVQFRPELANPRAIVDRRVRKALAHSIDRQGLVDALLEGQGLVADSLIFPQERWFPHVDRAVAKYPHDARRTEQILNEAGIGKGPDGVYSIPGEGRFSLELRISAGAQNEQQNEIVAEGWRRAGIDATSAPFPVARLQDGQFRASFPALQGSIGGNLDSLTSATIPRPDNRWLGSNRGAWSNPDYDRLFDAFNATLDTIERTRQVVEMARLISEELPVVTLYYDFAVVAHLAALRGPQIKAPESTSVWNLHQWEWK